jgi:hypothetical protein
MRFLCFLFLLAFAGAIGLFAYQNQEQEVTVKFWEWSITAAFPLIAGALFLIGMFTGWTIVGMLRRSVDRLVESPGQRR